MKNRSESRGTPWVLTRCDYLKAAGTAFAGFAAGAPFARANATGNDVRLCFGMVTDVHYADTKTRGTRHYRESTTKLAECIDLMNSRKVDFLIELGDFKDEDHPSAEESTLDYLKSIESVFAGFRGPRYHVLGNHDVDSISKAQFQAHVVNSGITAKACHYSFDLNGLHFIVLDANFKADGTAYDHGNFHWKDTHIPEWQIDWLRNDLASARTPAIVFVHQQLNDDQYSVRNAARVRDILQQSGKVLAVFHGHRHAGQYRRIEGIHYYTLKAMVEGSGTENSSYAVVEVHQDGHLAVKGYRKAMDRGM